MFNTINTIIESVITLIFLTIFAWFASREVEEDDVITEAFAEGYWEGVEPLPTSEELYKCWNCPHLTPEGCPPMMWDNWCPMEDEDPDEWQDAWEEKLYDLYSF